MKKFIVINIIVLGVLLLVAEGLCYRHFQTLYYRYHFSAQERAKSQVNGKIKLPVIKYTLPKAFNYEKLIQKDRERFFVGNSTKRPVVTIGCSVVDGVGLEENQTFAYKLYKNTSRTVYNRGVSDAGPAIVYRQLNDKNFKNEVPDAEYFIYVFDYNNICKQFFTLEDFYNTQIGLTYSVFNGKLVEDKHFLRFLYPFYTTKMLLDFKSKVALKIEEKNGYPLFMKTMEYSAAEMRKKYPDSKFVFLEIPEGAVYGRPYIKLSDENVKTLNDAGIIHIDAEKLVGHSLKDIKKYRVADEGHPNETFWDEVVPLFVKKLDL